MAVITLSFFDPSDGSLLGTLTDAQCKDIELRPALYELGAGSFTISRHHASAAAAMLQKGTIVTVTIPAVDADPFWGFILHDDLAVLISRAEQGGEDLTLTGPGLMAILGNARLDDDWWAPSPPASDARGSSTVIGQWSWIAQSAGAIFTRAVEEGQNQPGTPLGLVSIDFDRDDDSDGNPWTVMTSDYRVAVGATVLELSDRLSMTGQFTPVMVPSVTASVLTLNLSAYQAYGTDLSGSVSFEKGVNILTELTRETKLTRITHLIIKNLDGLFTRYVTTSPYDQANYGYLEVPETNDEWTTEQIGETALSASELNNEEFTLEIAPDLLPYRDFQPGDLVRVHTGSGEHDLNETTQRVVAVRIVLDEASKDTSTDTRERSLRIVAELSYRNGSGMSGTNAQPSNAVGLCCGPRPPTPTTTASPVMDEGHVYTEDEALDVIAVFGMDVTGGADTALVVLYTQDPTEASSPVDSLRWDPSGSNTAQSQNFSRIFGATSGMEVWVLIDPNPATDTDACIVQDAGGATWQTLSVYLTGLNTTDPWGAWQTATGSSATSSVTPATAAGDLVLNIGGWFENNATVATPTAGGGQTSIGTDTHDVAFGQRDSSMGGGWQIAAGSSVTPTWAFGASHPWRAHALVVRGTGTAGDSLNAIGATGEGTPGSSGAYIPIDAVLEHGDISASTDTYHTAESIALVDSGGDFTADNVEDALSEIFAALDDPVAVTEVWEAVTDGENVFVWEDDDLVHEWRAYP